MGHLTVIADSVQEAAKKAEKAKKAVRILGENESLFL